MNKKPLILITNDDGIYSPGIIALSDSLSEFAEVVIVAPHVQRSAVSSCLTIHRPLRVHKNFKNGTFWGYSIDGTPTDCIKIALSTLLERKPDLVISGINHGLNTSINVLYSGTIAGAIEGYLAGINSIAISHASHSLSCDMTYASEYAKDLARKLLTNTDEVKVLLNVNIPNLDKKLIKGTRLTKVGNSKWNDKYERRLDPFGNDYYWFASEYINDNLDIETDDGAIMAGYVSISKIKLNFDDDNFTNLENILDIEIEYNNTNRERQRGDDFIKPHNE